MIKIVPEPDVTCTQREYDYCVKLYRERKITEITIEDFLRQELPSIRAAQLQAEYMRNSFDGHAASGARSYFTNYF